LAQWAAKCSPIGRDRFGKALTLPPARPETAASRGIVTTAAHEDMNRVHTAGRSTIKLTAEADPEDGCPPTISGLFGFRAPMGNVTQLKALWRYLELYLERTPRKTRMMRVING